MAWVTPIIDRTIDDVTYAKDNQNLTQDLKGAFNISDANRIIDNTVYLRDLLNKVCYFPVVIPQNHLTEADIPNLESKINVMRTNVKSVVDSFYKRSNPTISFSDTLDYVMLNNIESNLDITNQLLVSLINELDFAGTFTSGETMYY